MSNSTVRVGVDLELRGSLGFGINSSSFPARPKLGTLWFKDGVLYGYQLVGGLETWYPLTNRTRSYVHTQGLASLQWTVNHGLGSVDNWYSVQDNAGNPLYCSRTIVDANSFTLEFTEPTEGRVVVVAPDDITVPAIQARLLTATSVNIGGGSVLFAAGSGSINGSPILTQAALDSGSGTFATLTGGKLSASQVPSNVALLGGDNKLLASQLPALAITDTYVVATQAEMLALDAQQGDVAVRSDIRKSFILATNSPTTLADWKEMLAPSSDVLSVNGMTGAVSVTTITGKAGSADRLATARTITLAGDLSGSASFDGSGDITLTATYQGDKVATKTFTGAVSCHYVNDGSYIKATVTGATTLSIAGVPNDGKAYGMTFKLTNAGTNVTWPASVSWLGTAPTLRASGISLVTLVTDDGGATWLGSAA